MRVRMRMRMRMRMRRGLLLMRMRHRLRQRLGVVSGQSGWQRDGRPRKPTRYITEHQLLVGIGGSVHTGSGERGLYSVLLLLLQHRRGWMQSTEKHLATVTEWRCGLGIGGVVAMTFDD
jgi:hypothetical protein